MVQKRPKIFRTVFFFYVHEHYRYLELPCQVNSTRINKDNENRCYLLRSWKTVWLSPFVLVCSCTVDTSSAFVLTRKTNFCSTPTVFLQAFQFQAQHTAERHVAHDPPCTSETQETKNSLSKFYWVDQHEYKHCKEKEKLTIFKLKIGLSNCFRELLQIRHYKDEDMNKGWVHTSHSCTSFNFCAEINLHDNYWSNNVRTIYLPWWATHKHKGIVVWQGFGLVYSRFILR